MPLNHPSRLLGAAIAGLLGFALPVAPADASALPPNPDSRLVGTWVNTNAATRSLKQITIVRDGSGQIMVDGFGACTPSLCEWGLVPATSYGASVSSRTGAHFQTNQRFLAGTTEWSRTAMFGKLTSTSAGLRLSVRQLTVFTDGSGRRNFTVSETFVPGEGQAPTVKGHPAVDYPQGLPPAPVSGMFGTWKNTSASPALDSLKVSPGAGGAPLVQAFGACSPTPCDMGTVTGITYGPSISSTTGRTVLAPYSFGFKNQQLVISYSRGRDGSESITVAHYSEFTDGSGRSNYTRREKFVRA